MVIRLQITPAFFKKFFLKIRYLRSDAVKRILGALNVMSQAAEFSLSERNDATPEFFSESRSIAL